MENIIETKSLSFKYSKSKLVLDNLSIHVPKGSIYGYIGPNGAGKSTTMSLLTGLLPEQSNAIELFGEPLQEQLPYVFSKIGSLVESPALYLHLSGYNNLKYVARIKKIPEDRISEVLEIVDLTKDSKRKVKQYSFGMKQRLAIAMTLLKEPELLLLDEPVNGLDPSGIIEIRELLIKLNQEKGVSIFISSHLLAEIEKMCTHVGIINNGKLEYEGPIAELSERTSFCKIIITLTGAKNWFDILQKEKEDVSFINDNQIVLQLENRESIPEKIKKLSDRDAKIYEVKIIEGLEESFMKITDKN